MKMDDEQLRRITDIRRQPRRDSTVRLDETIGRLMRGRLSPRHAKFGPVIEAWEQMLPPELSSHSRLFDIVGGELKIQVDSPAYMHELRLCSRQLVDELARLCPRARIVSINIVVSDTIADQQ